MERVSSEAVREAYKMVREYFHTPLSDPKRFAMGQAARSACTRAYLDHREVFALVRAGRD